MIYNIESLRNLRLKKIAGQLANVKLISTNDLAGVYAGCRDGFYTPSFFIRIGLFLASVILVSAATGLTALLFTDLVSSGTGFGMLLAIYGASSIWVLEYFISARKHYRSGIDDGLLYMGLLFIIIALLLFNGIFDTTAICLIALPFLLTATWRYADSLVALGAMICAFILVFMSLKGHATGRALMPFVFLAISGLCFYVFNSMLKRDSLFYFSDCLKTLKVASLLALYCSMNYFVVKEGNLMLMEDTAYGTNPTDQVLSESYEIPLAFLFLIFTALIPLVYIYWALRKKDRLLLWTGIAVLVFSAMTLKYRFNLLAIELTFIYSGILLCVVSWYVGRYLRRNPKYFTDEQDASLSGSDVLNAEALLIAQTMGTPGSPSGDNMKFGGGQYGGGGAGGNF